METGTCSNTTDNRDDPGPLHPLPPQQNVLLLQDGQPPPSSALKQQQQHQQQNENQDQTKQHKQHDCDDTQPHLEPTETIQQHISNEVGLLQLAH